MYGSSNNLLDRILTSVIVIYYGMYGRILISVAIIYYCMYAKNTRMLLIV